MVFLAWVLDSITFGGFEMKLAVWALKESGVLLKQHASGDSTTGQVCWASWGTSEFNHK